MYPSKRKIRLASVPVTVNCMFAEFGCLLKSQFREFDQHFPMVVVFVTLRVEIVFATVRVLIVHYDLPIAVARSFGVIDGFAAIIRSTASSYKVPF